MSVAPPIYHAPPRREPDLGRLDGRHKERRERDEARRRDHSPPPTSARTHWRELQAEKLEAKRRTLATALPLPLIRPPCLPPGIASPRTRATKQGG